VNDVCENEPAFFKRNLNLLFKALYSIFSNKKIEGSGIKRIACVSLIAYVERLN
jgi:hypothetical protein